MPVNIDFEAKQIDEGLTSLDELLAKPVATNALELSKNAATESQYQLLKRLRKSLRQYLERDGNLFYVGFLGHFSAGKSSTINSLLGAWNSKYERKTSLNPTDTTITLITQEKNSESLLGVIREGHVPIRLQTVESPIVESLVLVDTPGTGDPQFIEEAARDFLPICDVILFVLSAASPLDKSDVPLLLELHKRLPFIPLHFIVTRTDELRAEISKPMTEDNIDAVKMSQFLDGVISRVNTLLAPQVYMSANFTLIDNKSHFRVNSLSTFLATRCNTSMQQAHISMHINKLHFYRGGAKSLRDFFCEVLEGKLTELNNIVQAASRNIDRYQRNVQISNGNLTKAWSEYAGTISASSSCSADALKEAGQLPQHFTGFQSVANERSEIAKYFWREAKFYGSNLSNDLKTQVHAALRDHFYRVQRDLNGTPIDQLSASSNAVATLKVNVGFSNKEVFASSMLTKKCNELRESEASALRDAGAEAKRLIKELDDILRKRAPLNDCETVITSARDVLTLDLNQFFQNVELYRSGVFSHTTKESIATLGIGKRLDDLEAEFTEEDRALYATEAVNDFFPEADKLFTNSSSLLGELSERVRSLSDSMRLFKVELTDNTGVPIQERLSADRDEFQRRISAEIQTDVDRFCADVNQNLANALVDIKGKYAAHMQTIHSSRTRRYVWIAFLTAFVFSCAYLAYRHYKRPAPSTTLGEAILSIACGLITEIIVLAIVKSRENLPKLIADTKDDFRAKLNEKVRELTEGALNGQNFDSLNDVTITNRIYQMYDAVVKVTPETWQHRAADLLASMVSVRSGYSRFRGEYLKINLMIRQKGLEYFTDETRNFQILNRVAAGIKERAIEPSFALLDQTREELSSVKTQVAAVQFD